MFTRIRFILSNSKVVACANAILVLLAVFVNIYFQAFCIPTLWASVIIFICFLNIILMPILPNNYLMNVIEGFINGISFFVYFYCIIFLEHINILGIWLVLIGVGIATYVPHIFLIQMLWQSFKKRRSVEYFRSMFFAFVICVFSIVSIGFQYKTALTSIESFKESNFQQLDKTYMTEKILGMHFIYHTRICEYDGWRPPKHDPILIIGLWLNHRIDPLNISLKDRLKLYKKFFPNNQFKFKCSCAIEGSEEYKNDTLWKEPGS